MRWIVTMIEPPRLRPAPEAVAASLPMPWWGAAYSMTVFRQTRTRRVYVRLECKKRIEPPRAWCRGPRQPPGLDAGSSVWYHVV